MAVRLFRHSVSLFLLTSLNSDFLSSQGLPHYIPPTRVGPEFTPRKRPFRGSYQATRLCVAGGNYLWELGRDPTPMDLLYSTTGTTVVPVRGR